jgi:ABC-type nickel/cobalt efflux system permease component RcnA
VTTVPVLLLASAGVGFGHAILPDHWVPLAVLARTRRTPLGRVLRQSSLAAVTHVLLSVLLGGLLILIGLRFRATVQRHEDLVVGGILLATGLALLVLELLGRGYRHGDGHAHGHGHGHAHDHDHADDHRDHDHDHDHDHSHGHDHQHSGASRAPRDRLAFIVPFGAAASPDLTILPVFLAASALGGGPAAGSLAVFAAVTVVTIVGLTVLTAAGARLLTGPRLERGIDRRANLLTAATLVVIGGLVASGVI